MRHLLSCASIWYTMLYDDVIASVDFFVRINNMCVHQKINDHLDTICFNGKRDVVGVVVDVVVIHDFLNHYYFQIDFLDLINHKLLWDIRKSIKHKWLQKYLVFACSWNDTKLGGIMFQDTTRHVPFRLFAYQKIDHATNQTCVITLQLKTCEWNKDV